jgi:delta14-sterol reductase
LTARELAGSAALFGGFVAVLFLASLLVPGPMHEGAPDPRGGRRRYTLNGFRIFVATAVILAAGVAADAFTLLAVHERFWSLFAVANLFAFAASAALMLAGERRPSSLRDYVLGAEKDPAWLGCDLKLFSYRPSLIGLAVINASFAAEQHAAYGFISMPMALYQAFTFVYVAHYFQFERGMLYTWDVIEERFGWMLVWGDYVFVPFFYSLPGWFLLHRTAPLPPLAVAGLVALYLFGFWLFRGANEQKHRFKLDPGTRIWGRPAEALGGKLLLSGFWGIGRKLNYTGELCMYSAWTLTCGTTSIVPYLVPLWLTAFFPWRVWRDDRRCRAKYGLLWEEYCRRASFRMVPYLY